MRIYNVNPDGTVVSATNRTTEFKERLKAKFPTPEMDKKDDKEFEDYDNHKLFN